MTRPMTKPTPIATLTRAGFTRKQAEDCLHGLVHAFVTSRKKGKGEWVRVTGFGTFRFRVEAQSGRVGAGVVKRVKPVPRQRVRVVEARASAFDKTVQGITADFGNATRRAVQSHLRAGRPVHEMVHGELVEISPVRRRV